MPYGRFEGGEMKAYFKSPFLLLMFLFLVSCNKDKEIKRLLNSKHPREVVEGAWQAGETGDIKYVPLLLQDCGKPSVSTALHFIGFSIYVEKMGALRKILKVDPPHRVEQFSHVDSVNIKFYIQYWKDIRKKKGTLNLH